MAIGSFISGVYHTAANAVDTVGKGISAVGNGISEGAHWVQHKVEDGVTAVDHAVDSTVDRFEHSALGDNVVGHALGDFAKASTHFTGGVVKGAASLGTGVVGLAGTVVKLDGGALQYASNSEYRHETNEAVSNFATNFAKDPTAIVRNVGTAVKNAWEHDPADFLGQAVGVVGATVLTAGAGTAAEAAGAAGRVGTAVEGADALVTAGRAGETLQIAGRTGEAVEGAAARGTGEAIEGAAARGTGEAAESAGARGAGEAAETPAPPEFVRMSPKDLPDTPAYEGYDNVASHMTEPGRMAVPRSKGVTAGHYEGELEAGLGKNGQIISDTSVENLEGVSVKKYQLFKELKGELTTDLKKGEFPKTVFDPAEWSPEDITKLARNAFGDKVKDAVGAFDGSFNGVDFVGWAREGQLQSFGIKID